MNSKWAAIGLALSALAATPALAQPAVGAPEVFAAAIPESYPKDAPLPQISRWLHEEYTRIAVEAHRKQMENIKLPEGSCGGTIGVVATPAALPRAEWRRLSERCASQLAGTDDQRQEALQFIFNLEQVALVGKLPELLGPEMRSAVAALAANPDVSISVSALRAMRTMASVAPVPGAEELRAAIGALQHRDATVRTAAVQALADMTIMAEPGSNALGDLAPAAIDGVLPITSDGDRLARLNAVRVIARTGEHVRPLMPRLAGWLEGNDRLMRSAVYLSMESLGPEGEPLVQKLLAIARDPTNAERTRAVMALGYLGQGGKAAVQPLLELAAEADENVAGIARLSLARLGTVAASAGPTLREMAAANPVSGKELRWVADITEGKKKIGDPME